MRRLHSEIMRIQVLPEIEDYPTGTRIIYKTGHRDARHAAAELANEQDALVERLAGALREMVGIAEFREWDNPQVVIARDLLAEIGEGE